MHIYMYIIMYVYHIKMHISHLQRAGLHSLVGRGGVDFGEEKLQHISISISISTSLYIHIHIHYIYISYLQRTGLHSLVWGAALI